jgi:hypothetical protein
VVLIGCVLSATDDIAKKWIKKERKHKEKYKSNIFIGFILIYHK